VGSSTVVATAVFTGTTGAVACPVGHPFATGGGFASTTLTGNNVEPRVSAPVGGTPATPASGWTVTWNMSNTFTVYAICSA
jgi:hypothetical protein